jgi:DNA-binding NarL/FixJ family response regulator
MAVGVNIKIMRLLLAAKQADLRVALELLLGEQPGAEVVGSASEGEGLLALIKTSKPSLIVSDWNLPGQPLVSILAEREQLCPQASMIVLTDGNRDRQAALEAGADAAVLKGASPDILLAAFRNLQRQKNASQEIEKHE